MSLTVGTGPFGQRPGVFNFEVPTEEVEYVEDHPKRIRAERGGETVIDSTRVKLHWRHGSLPRFWFPEEDARVEEAERSDNPALAGYVHVPWDAVDQWFEEDEPAIVHPRDPYHRIDILDTSRRVRISVHGEVLAKTTRARALFETGLPPRWYIPPEDVRAELFEDSDLETGCAYKGFAGYWSVRAGEELEMNLSWVYRDPRPEAERIRDMICFFNERVDLELDGELQERPVTPWSKPIEGPQTPP